MRLTALKVGVVSVLGVLGVLSCSARDLPDDRVNSTSDGRRGDIELGLVPVSGVTLNVIHYVVTSSATPPALIAEGDLPTPGSSSDFNVGLSLPVGTGYTISLSAASAQTGDDITCGGSFGPFDVTPNGVSSFKVTLTCNDVGSGQIIDGTQVVTDACPRLVFEYAVATPAAGTVAGPPVAVSAKAHDLDGKTVSYSWQASAATFSPATGEATQLTCVSTAPGMPVTVSASNGECSKSLLVRVTCSTASCGDGVVDPGESCDKALVGNLCPADCIIECGDGLTIPPVEDCDPGNTDNCNGICRFRTAVCGDGFFTTVGPNPEACDGLKVPPGTPASVQCNSSCSGFVPKPIVECFNGIVDPGEECDDGGSGSATCSPTCKKISTQACVDCENAGDCFESVDNCQGVAAPFSASDKLKCFEVMGCIEASNCFDGAGTLGKCYCGSLNTSQCGAAPFSGPGSPDGACVAQIKGGFPNFTSNTQIIAGLVATNFPAGAAMKRLSCQKGANNSACLDACGFTAGGPAFP
jgi:hypothetical protein